MKDLYRKSALERLSSPDQLDKVIRIASPLSWLAFLAVTAVAAAVIAWSMVGTIQETITVKGIVVAPTGTNAVYTDVTGTVSAAHVTVGSELQMGTPVMEITTPQGELVTILSDQVGTVSDLAVTAGSAVSQSSELVRVSPKVQGSQAVVCYVPVASAQKLRRGMQAYVTLTAAEREICGHMTAQVVNIDARAASASAMERVLGSGSGMADAFTQGSAAASVALELCPDAHTVSGYAWSNARGAGQAVPNGSLCSVRLITGEVRPIEKLFAGIREIRGE